jgi:hypothetical protein
MSTAMIFCLGGDDAGGWLSAIRCSCIHVELRVVAGSILQLHNLNALAVTW